MGDVPVRVGGRVEVLDETSPFYHLIGNVTAVSAGRVLVEFAQKDHGWNYPNDKKEVEFAPDQVGVAMEEK